MVHTSDDETLIEVVQENWGFLVVCFVLVVLIVQEVNKIESASATTERGAGGGGGGAGRGDENGKGKAEKKDL